jgi:hypothetical protein
VAKTWDRVSRDVSVVIFVLMPLIYVWMVSRYGPGWIGGDLRMYQQHVSAWLAGGPDYPAYELAGPFTIETGVILYPPTTLALFVASLALPAALWWILPGLTSGAVVWRLRPKPWAFLAMGCLLLFPTSISNIAGGNPDIWIVAALAVAVYWRPAAAFVLIKPSVFPLALLGVRHRGWWVIAGLFAAGTLALLPQTLDWLRVLQNGVGPRSGLLYSLEDVPLLLVPLVAWAGATRRPVRASEEKVPATQPAPASG